MGRAKIVNKTLPNNQYKLLVILPLILFNNLSLPNQKQRRGQGIMENQLNDLPANVQRCLTDFINTAKVACGENLVYIVLFGSAAEGRLRATSNVNLML